MGNLITTMTTIVAPLMTKEFIIPTLMHPYRWGGVPFKAPGLITYCLMYVIFTLLIIGAAATVSGMMSSSKECNKMSFWTSAFYARWAVLGALIGMLFVFIFAFLKAPVLALLSWLPYSNTIVDGLYMSLFVIFMGMIGNNFTRARVCKGYEGVWTDTPP